MQGRLSPMYNGKIQKFPINHWKSEFYIANSLNINLIEWILPTIKSIIFWFIHFTGILYSELYQTYRGEKS